MNFNYISIGAIPLLPQMSMACLIVSCDQKNSTHHYDMQALLPAVVLAGHALRLELQRSLGHTRRRPRCCRRRRRLRGSRGGACAAVVEAEGLCGCPHTRGKQLSGKRAAPECIAQGCLCVYIFFQQGR